MKKLFPMFVFVILMVPSITFGADTGGLVPCSGPECELCDLLTLVQRILNFLMELATYAAILIIALTGVQMMVEGGDPVKHGKLRKRSKGIVIGFLLMLGAWLIIDTGMKLILNEQVYGGWNTIECSSPNFRVKEHGFIK